MVRFIILYINAITRLKDMTMGWIKWESEILKQNNIQVIIQIEMEKDYKRILRKIGLKVVNHFKNNSLIISDHFCPPRQ